MLPHLDAAFNYARWLTRNAPDAEDVVQDAYVRAFRFFPSFRGDDARAWLLAIVRNTCYGRFRRRGEREALPFDERVHDQADPAPDPEARALAHATAEEVRCALDRLPADFREVLVLREIEGLSYKEIAAVLSVPIGTVMSRLSRARERLLDVMAPGRTIGGSDVVS